MCIIAWVSCLAVSCSIYFLKSLFHCVGSSHFVFRLPPVVIKHAACSLLSPRRNKHCQTRVMVLQLRGSSMPAAFGLLWLSFPFSIWSFSSFFFFHFHLMQSITDIPNKSIEVKIMYIQNFPHLPIPMHTCIYTHTYIPGKLAGMKHLSKLINKE